MKENTYYRHVPIYWEGTVMLQAVLSSSTKTLTGDMDKRQLFLFLVGYNTANPYQFGLLEGKNAYCIGPTLR